MLTLAATPRILCAGLRALYVVAHYRAAVASLSQNETARVQAFAAVGKSFNPQVQLVTPALLHAAGNHVVMPSDTFQAERLYLKRVALGARQSEWGYDRQLHFLCCTCELHLGTDLVTQSLWPSRAKRSGCQHKQVAKILLQPAAAQVSTSMCQ